MSCICASVHRQERANEAKKLDFSSPFQLCELNEKCRTCPIVGHCPTCYGINFGTCGNVYHVPDDHCRMMKVCSSWQEQSSSKVQI